MPVLGITGGIATGKSSFVRTLLRQLPMDFFDADQCARELLASDSAVRLAVGKVFGMDIFDPQGQPDRRRLRELVFADEASRKKLESILHPAIRTRWTTLAKAATATNSWLCIDLPLLYETAVESYFDRIVVVACTATTQERRLREERGMPPELAARIIAAQLDLSQKIKQADHLIWNDATLSCLDGQASLLCAWFRQRYG